MKKLIILTISIVTFTALSIGQCNSLFSFAAYFNQVTFVNQSTVSNAHYFWNFGDGTGSNLANPLHTFPGSGDYLVTLFAKDTISNCSSYYEYWLDVTKYSDDCQPSISDSIYSYDGGKYLNIFNTSANCNGYNMIYSAGPNCNYLPIHLLSAAFRMVCVGDYTFGGNIIMSAYKTAYYNYSSSHNYGDCSANFEFIVVSKDSLNERILFTAMNKTAIFYKWEIDGFGNPIYSSYDTISQVFPINPYCPGIVGLIIQGSTGCYDTIWQNIWISDSTKTILSVNDLKDAIGKVDIYPNPSKAQFTFDFNAPITGTIKICDITGREVAQFTINNSQLRIDLSRQPAGVYFYRAITNRGSLIGEGKIVVQK